MRLLDVESSNMKKKNRKKRKAPKISEKEIAELTQAVQFAFGDQAADQFIDEVLATLGRHRRAFVERGEQSHCE